MDVKTLKLFMPILTKEIEVDKAGSTSLKHARVRWAIPKLEILAVKYMLNKCHFYTAWETKTILVYSDCKGLKQY